jgi:hypothetical protein
MGKLVVSLDNVVIKEVTILKERTTLGRRPYNDIVIDNLAVSGEHAVLLAVGEDVFLEDLNSTNGSYINGKPIKKQLLANNDTIEIGKYRLKYQSEDMGDYEKTMILRPGSTPAPVVPPRSRCSTVAQRVGKCCCPRPSPPSANLAPKWHPSRVAPVAT